LADMYSNEDAAAFQSEKSAGETPPHVLPADRLDEDLMATSRSAAGNASGLSSTPYTVLKTAVLAPIPRASAAIATAAGPGVGSSIRAPNRRSCQSASMKPNPHILRVSSLARFMLPKAR